MKKNQNEKRIYNEAMVVNQLGIIDVSKRREFQ